MSRQPSISRNLSKAYNLRGGRENCAVRRKKHNSKLLLTSTERQETKDIASMK
jgi:hypothetical protein